MHLQLPLQGTERLFCASALLSSWGGCNGAMTLVTLNSKGCLNSPVAKECETDSF